MHWSCQCSDKESFIEKTMDVLDSFSSVSFSERTECVNQAAGYELVQRKISLLYIKFTR